MYPHPDGGSIGFRPTPAGAAEEIAERFTHQVVRDATHAASGSTVPTSATLEPRRRPLSVINCT